MALTRHSKSSTVFLQAKHYCLWREIKKAVDGCDSVEVTNPKTGDVLTKYGFRYHDVSGLVTACVWYDTEKKYSTRYIGFKLHLKDGADSYVVDMPYQSQMLRRFLRMAPNIDWSFPLSITVFKGKKQDGSEELAVWFQQGGETVKSFYTKDHPNGMPEATQDPITKDWDFKPQHRWLVGKLRDEIILKISEAAKRSAPPVEPVRESTEEPEPDYDPYGGQGITDDDVPF